MLEFILRAVSMYFMAMVMIRVLGKRALGELGPFDFVVMTGVGHTVVSIALDQSLPVYEGMAVLLTFAVLEYMVSFLALKNARLSNLISGRPKILIDNGCILKENLRREMFNVDDLMQELRKQGVRDLNQVEKGILEACGGFSVILKEADQPVTCRDLGIKKTAEGDALNTVEGLSRAEIFRLNQHRSVAQSEFDLVYTLRQLTEKTEEVRLRLQQLESKQAPQEKLP